MASEGNCINVGLVIQQLQTHALVSAGKVSLALACASTENSSKTVQAVIENAR